MAKCYLQNLVGWWIFNENQTLLKCTNSIRWYHISHHLTYSDVHSYYNEHDIRPRYFITTAIFDKIKTPGRNCTTKPPRIHPGNNCELRVHDPGPVLLPSNSLSENKNPFGTFSWSRHYFSREVYGFYFLKMNGLMFAAQIRNWLTFDAIGSSSQYAQFNSR